MALTLADLITIVPVLQQNVIDLQASVNVLTLANTTQDSRMDNQSVCLVQLCAIINRMVIQQQPPKAMLPLNPPT